MPDAAWTTIRIRVDDLAGPASAFEPARRLYEGFGFAYCSPFDGYTDDPNSVFMTPSLDDP